MDPRMTSAGSSPLIPGAWKLVTFGPNLDLVSNPGTDSTLELSRICEDPNETTDLSSSYPDVVDSFLRHLVKYFQFKPDSALATPLSEPDGWSQPRDWGIAE